MQTSVATALAFTLQRDFSGSHISSCLGMICERRQWRQSCMTAIGHRAQEQPASRQRCAVCVCAVPGHLVEETCRDGTVTAVFLFLGTKQRTKQGHTPIRPCQTCCSSRYSSASSVGAWHRTVQAQRQASPEAADDVVARLAVPVLALLLRLCTTDKNLPGCPGLSAQQICGGLRPRRSCNPCRWYR